MPRSALNGRDALNSRGNDMAQKAEILSYLKKGRSLTALSALRLFNVLRLGGRIHELRRDGHKIRTHPVRLANKKIIARYSLSS
jgi:hypothetical protein